MNPKIDKVLIQEDTKMNHAYTLTVQYGKRSSIRDVRTEGERRCGPMRTNADNGEGRFLLYFAAEVGTIS